jgi:hypothetical protein
MGLLTDSSANIEAQLQAEPAESLFITLSSIHHLHHLEQICQPGKKEDHFLKCGRSD